MTKHLTPRPLKQRLQESIKSAMRGYKHLVDIERVLEAYKTANDGKVLDVLKVDMSLRDDITICMALTREIPYNWTENMKAYYMNTQLEFVSK